MDADSCTNDTVVLYVFGLRSFVPDPIQARAFLSSTWYEFLNDVCGIQVGPEDKIMAATTSHSIPAKRGWSADLNEEIRIFVDKFSSKRAKYSVRLMHQLGPTTGAVGKKNKGARCAVGKKNKGTRGAVGKKNKGTRGGVGKKFNGFSKTSNQKYRSNPQSSKRNGAENRRTSNSIGNHVFPKAERLVEEEVENVYPIQALETRQEDRLPMEAEYQVDASGLALVPARVEFQQRSRIQKDDDLKNLILYRARAMQNPFLLRVRNEIMKLKRSNLWYRCVQVAPLSSYLLDEVFGQEM